MFVAVSGIAAETTFEEPEIISYSWPCPSIRQRQRELLIGEVINGQ